MFNESHLMQQHPEISQYTLKVTKRTGNREPLESPSQNVVKSWAKWREVKASNSIFFPSQTKLKSTGVL